MADSRRPPFRVSHIIFDVDGTLVDFVGAVRPATEAIATRISEIAGIAVEAASLYAARDEVAADPQWRRRAFVDVRQESFRRVVAPLVDDPESVATELATLFFDVRNRSMHVYPDVHQTLEALTSRGFALVAGSNGNVDLGAVGLTHYFTDVHHAEAIGFSKPDPRFFEHIARPSGAAPEVTIGDRRSPRQRLPARARVWDARRAARPRRARE